MSKEWSSFPAQQVLVENWKKYLEQPTPSANLNEAAKEQYPADDLLVIANTLAKLSGKGYEYNGKEYPDGLNIDQGSRDKIVEEFYTMLQGEGFVVKEAVVSDADASEALMFGKPLPFVLPPTGSLTRTLIIHLYRVLRPDYIRFMKMLARGGFSIKSLQDFEVEIENTAQDRDARLTARNAGTQQAQGEQEPAQAATPVDVEEEPVALFGGDNALYSKLFSTIFARFKNKEVAGAPIQLDKGAVQNTVKQILKDLSAQLRANGLKVQESNIPMLADLIVEELQRTLLVEVSRSRRRRERAAAQAAKGGEMGTSTTYTSTATAGQGKPSNAAERWVAAGKPELTRVSGNNLVTRDADHYASAKKGTLKPAALEYAKAQVAWLQQNKPDQGIPDILTQAIEITAADPQARHYGGGKTGTGSRVEPTKGQVDAGRAVGGKITALIGQAAGADIQDREQRKMVTTDIQQDLKAIIMKVVKPHLQKHLQNKGIKLKETKARTNEKK